ncbi:MAG: hypothetical protein IJU40_06410 [Desulfovibrionaceae bacterium]|nr:hypothetical protein [Desulfovibrionaceae bacterium]
METVNPLTLLPTPPSADIPNAPKTVRSYISALWNKALELGKQCIAKGKEILFLEKQNSDLTAENEDLKKENDSLNANFLAILGEKNSLIAKLKDLQKENKTLKRKVDSLTEKNKQLTNKLNQNSENSSRPPSKDPIGFKRKKGEKSDPKQKTKNSSGANKDDKPKKPRKAHHPGATRPLLPPTEEEDCYPTVCPHCGGNHFEDLHKIRAFQNIELPEQPLDVHQFNIYAGTCPCCGKVVKGSVPDEFNSAYGPRLSAFIAQLDSQTGTTRRQLKEVLLDVFSLPISLGGIQNIAY